jgi:hypothetical protein
MAPPAAWLLYCRILSACDAVGGGACARAAARGRGGGGGAARRAAPLARARVAWAEIEALAATT